MQYASNEDFTFTISVCQVVEVMQQPVDPEIKREEMEEQDPQSAASSNSMYESLTTGIGW